MRYFYIKCALLCGNIFLSMHGMGVVQEPPISIDVTGGLAYICKILNTAHERTWVLFDIDDTLTVYDDPYDRNFQRERRSLNMADALCAPGCQDKDLCAYLVARAWFCKKRRLLNAEMPGIIQELQKRKVVTLAITDSTTGKYGEMETFEDYRIKELAKLGIDFRAAFPLLHEIVFEQLQRGGNVPLFKGGILFTGHACNKGDLLLAFIEALGTKPHSIISIDDQEQNLISEYLAANSLGIFCTLIRYVAAGTLPGLYRKDIAEFQLKHLCEHNEWLTGARALECMQEIRRAQTKKNGKKRISCSVQ